jgi:trk system potassium uptake protein TrkH
MSRLSHVLNRFRTYLKALSVARAVCISFGLAILTGSLFLFFSESGKLSYIDSLYLSASAFCVTGLSPVPISSLSFTGQLLILTYVQMGGLGIIVFTVLIGILVIKGLSRNTKLHDFLYEVLDSDLKAEIKKDNLLEQPRVFRILIAIFNIAFTIEIIGAIILYFTLPEKLPAKVDSRIFLSLFTSISAFNNAGFSISDDLSFILHDHTSLAVIIFLIVAGGIGFPVIIFIEKVLLKTLNEITSKFEVWCETYLMRKAIKGEEPAAFYFYLTKLSLWTEYRIESYNKSLKGESNRAQTSIILIGTIFLIFLGFVSFYWIEYNNPSTLANLNWKTKVMNSLLVSVSSRTAGFNTFDMSGIYDPTIIILCSLMFVGGGPQGTAGGIKITTFVILVQYLRNVINSQSKVMVFGQLVSKNSVAMSIRLYFLSTTVLVVIIFLLSILHPNHNQIEKIIFEVISAFGTVGFSLDFTNKLTEIEKVIYAILMYCGRIGIFTVLVAVTGNPVTSQLGETDDGLKIQVG